VVPAGFLRAEIRSLSPHFQLGEGGSAGRSLVAAGKMVTGNEVSAVRVSRGPRVVLRAEIRSLSPHFQLGEGGSAGRSLVAAGKNGDRQRSFRSEGVSWSPCGFACGNSKPVTTFPAGRRGFRGSIFSGRWKNGGCLVVPAGFWSAEIRSLSPHFQLCAGVVAHGCYSESEWRNRRC
jgi:hypothetical protein